MMTNSWRRTCVTLFVLAAFLGGLTLEDLHHHPLSAMTFAGPSLMSHSCGDREKHIPLDRMQLCSVCHHTFQRAAVLRSAEALSPSVRAFSLARLWTTNSPAQPHFFSSGKRGPPAA